MQRKALTDKIIVLGVDGFEPSLAKKFMDQGKMPALAQFVEKGSAREDLVLLGGMPTVTPPMWTTLATGAYPVTHGITAFFNQHPDKLDTAVYALDSRLCKAEPLWNVFAESGKKTMVWHWPGSAWPPTSESPNLHVVDGTQPGGVNMGVAVIDWEKLGLASVDIPQPIYAAHDAPGAGVNGCIITGLEDAIAKEGEVVHNGASAMKSVLGGMQEIHSMVLNDSETEVESLGKVNLDVMNSPIKEACGWADAPADAREFTIITSGGYTRRPALILKNDEGVYDRIAIYKNKKETTPLFTMHKDEFGKNYVDEINDKGTIKMGNRNMIILELAPDASRLRFWMSCAYDVKHCDVWHPKSLQQEMVENVGYIQPNVMIDGKDPEHAQKIMLPAWDNYCDWQADCLRYLMDNGGYSVIFSHLHNVDLIGHKVWHYAKHRQEWGNDEAFYQDIITYVYKQTDDYLAKFLPYLDEGWTMIITSDHGLITEENHPPILTEGTVSIPVMRALGYTVLKKDANGDELREIDWEKTRAIAVRGGHIYINLKGRNATGVVEPADKYELEGRIISDLYNYRDPHTGKRVVSLALRNKDAVILGMGGPESGDILFFMDEGFNIIHMDSLSTYKGYWDTSVSPIFVAAGCGIKAGYTTDRYIRQVDVAPTMAALGGVRMPAQNEGSVIHQILTEEF